LPTIPDRGGTFRRGSCHRSVGGRDEFIRGFIHREKVPFTVQDGDSVIKDILQQRLVSSVSQAAGDFVRGESCRARRSVSRTGLLDDRCGCLLSNGLQRILLAGVYATLASAADDSAPWFLHRH
jgi:hypothetical protein